MKSPGSGSEPQPPSNARTTLIIVGVLAAAFVAGAALRDRTDLNSGEELAGSDFSRVGLVASTDTNGGYTAGDYFYQLTRLLKREYVDPITDEQKLASGAIRSMIGSLGDPEALFMDKKQFSSYTNARAGRYEGIGVDLTLVVSGAKNPLALPEDAAEGAPSENTAEEALATRIRVPRLVVSNVAPNGPAAKAGVKVGDYVYSVDDHWVVNTDLLIKFQKAQEDFRAKKIDFAQLNKVRKEVRAKTERALLPSRAMERLTVGTTGAVAVVWERAGKQLPTKMSRAQTTVAPFSKSSDGTLRLSFVKGADEWIEKELRGAKSARIDLRRNVSGDFEVVKAVLEKVAPKGDYGQIVTQRPADNTMLTVAKGNASAPKLELLVDSTTRGAAEVFALALESRGRAKLVGSKMAGVKTVSETVQLPDGSGYVLPVGEYRVRAERTKVVMTDTKESIR